MEFANIGFWGDKRKNQKGLGPADFSQDKLKAKRYQLKGVTVMAKLEQTGNSRSGFPEESTSGPDLKIRKEGGSGEETSIKTRISLPIPYQTKYRCKWDLSSRGIVGAREK